MDETSAVFVCSKILIPDRSMFDLLKSSSLQKQSGLSISDPGSIQKRSRDDNYHNMASTNLDLGVQCTGTCFYQWGVDYQCIIKEGSRLGNIPPPLQTQFIPCSSRFRICNDWSIFATPVHGSRYFFCQILF